MSEKVKTTIVMPRTISSGEKTPNCTSWTLWIGAAEYANWWPSMMADRNTATKTTVIRSGSRWEVQGQRRPKRSTMGSSLKRRVCEFNLRPKFWPQRGCATNLEPLTLTPTLSYLLAAVGQKLCLDSGSLSMDLS